MTSEAAVMSKPEDMVRPFFSSPRPVTMLRRLRSLTSRHRRHSTFPGWMRRSLPWKIWLSTMAASRLLAAVMA